MVEIEKKPHNFYLGDMKNWQIKHKQLKIPAYNMQHIPIFSPKLFLVFKFCIRIFIFSVKFMRLNLFKFPPVRSLIMEHFKGILIVLINYRHSSTKHIIL